ncbi:MAG: DUF3047 domain-containing protein [Desulfobulbaceae bacterium]|nr:DUF3047 domain-containing protein [Desulfobulbaceae bacterium]
MKVDVSPVKKGLSPFSFFPGRGFFLQAAAVLVYAPFFFVMLCVFSGPAFPEDILIDENFDNLDDWVPVLFPKIDRHSEYTVQKTDAGSMLVARSNASASGIRFVREFNVYEYPVVRWRWKVENVYKGGDAERKSGDDYPLRVYVIFKYDPGKAGIRERILYGLARTVYDEYPPHSSLNYIWANRSHERIIYPSPYTDRARLVILRAGEAETGMWKEEEVHILDDYAEAFASPPPATASIAIMNDSDNTGESSVSYLDYIQVLRKE